MPWCLCAVPLLLRWKAYGKDLHVVFGIIRERFPGKRGDLFVLIGMEKVYADSLVNRLYLRSEDFRVTTILPLGRTDADIAVGEVECVQRIHVFMRAMSSKVGENSGSKPTSLSGDP